ncbi:acetate kinase [Tahibacter aquaticus]|uniref:Acetate kinase n=1 Tax=Tahibacter aquaticus TaxID=520092 RepID=A0A4R6YT58_9GAMM|nr:acetate kinase [Tahibacter aquaticus]TDR41569.1 acetate kinase [Tahibacter aquaticus]
MSDEILALNVGSSSLRFALFDAADLALRLRGHVDFGKDHARTSLSGPLAGHLGGFAAAGQDAGEAVEQLIDSLHVGLPQLSLRCASHRIVHGGDLEPRPYLLHAGLIERLEHWAPMALLHQSVALKAVRRMAQRWPGLPQVACFDTTFHAGQPEVARLYALPRHYTEAGIRRYGFHGVACEFIADALPRLAGPIADGRVVIVHLGSGSSLCALQQRRSIASSMGFSVLDGLPMGTRCGSLDPGVILHLLDKSGMTVADVEDLLYRRSGLLGVSGISADVRVLEASDDPRAQQALDLLVYRAVAEIGAMAARLQGLDAIVFSGGAGTGSPALRARIAERCGWLGVELDAAANGRGDESIGRIGARVAVYVVHVDEELMLARAARPLL